MPSKACLLLCLAIFANPSVRAQQAPQPPIDPSNTAGMIHCHNQPYVTVTADPEQAVPLQVVATVSCNEEVRILSDTQGYTVKVRTASGKIGFVSRYEVTVDSSKQEAAGPKTTPPETPFESRPDTPEKDSSKPRIYVSDTDSWTASGGFSSPSSVAPGNLYGGYNPELTDIYQDFTSDCPAGVVTQQKSGADYVVLFDKQSSKKGLTGLGGLVKVNKVTVLSKDGNTLLSQTSHNVDAAVKMACDAIGHGRGASGP